MQLKEADGQLKAYKTAVDVIDGLDDFSEFQVSARVAYPALFMSRDKGNDASLVGECNEANWARVPIEGCTCEQKWLKPPCCKANRQTHPIGVQKLAQGRYW